MEREPDRSQQSRENVLATSLVLLVGGMILFYLYIISLGIVGNVLGIGVAFVMLGAMHYLLWGRASRPRSPPNAKPYAGRTLRKSPLAGNSHPRRFRMSRARRASKNSRDPSSVFVFFSRSRDFGDARVR